MAADTRRHTKPAAAPQNGAPKAGRRKLVHADPEAERALLGALLIGGPAAHADAAPIIGPADFADHNHAEIADTLWRMVAAGEPSDPVAVASALDARGTLEQVGGLVALLELQGAGVTSSAGRYARTIGEQARIRRLYAAAGDMAHAIEAGDPAGAEATLRTIYEQAPLAEGRPQAVSLDEFLSGEQPDYDWLIPGLLERTDRAVLTGVEGTGKSMFLRQLAVCVAAGIHPFTLASVAPARVLYVDLENSADQSRRKLRPMRIKAGDAVKGNMWVLCRPQGLDLLNPGDAAFLAAEVRNVGPDLLIIGPIYKMTSGNPNDEQDTVPVARALDDLRARHHLAIVLEGHSPHAETPSRKRPTRPIGSSVWMRWPEFGLHLGADGELTHWRGARDERDWPTQLQRGGTWPWSPAAAGQPAIGIDVALVALLEATEGTEFTSNNLLTALRAEGHQFRDAAVRQVAQELAKNGAIRCRTGAKRAQLYMAKWRESDEDF